MPPRITCVAAAAAAAVAVAVALAPVLYAPPIPSPVPAAADRTTSRSMDDADLDRWLILLLFFVAYQCVSKANIDDDVEEEEEEEGIVPYRTVLDDDGAATWVITMITDEVGEGESDDSDLSIAVAFAVDPIYFIAKSGRDCRSFRVRSTLASNVPTTVWIDFALDRSIRR
jgi:hypothetical protein